MAIADLHNELADTHNAHKFELQQMEERMHLVEQAKGLSEEAWISKTEKLVQQHKREVCMVRCLFTVLLFVLPRWHVHSYTFHSVTRVSIVSVCTAGK